MPLNERHSILTELNPPFVIERPAAQNVPIVYCSPHSGRVYPSALLKATRLDQDALRRSEDCYVDQLFESVTASGAPLIAARFPRAYLDVNREPYELDPELFDEPLPPFANAHTMRVIGGLGTIARVVSEAEEIYHGPIPLAAALERIERLHKPFHEALAGLIEETSAQFGYAILIDCHSMPSASVAYPASARPDFVLGDRFGGSCDQRVTRAVRDLIASLKYQVQLNRPYAGGYITEFYGRPREDVHAIQIEINRGLYLNERNLTRGRRFKAFQEDITWLTGRLAEVLPALFEARLAAE